MCVISLDVISIFKCKSADLSRNFGIGESIFVFIKYYIISWILIIMCYQRELSFVRKTISICKLQLAIYTTAGSFSIAWHTQPDKSTSFGGNALIDKGVCWWYAHTAGKKKNGRTFHTHKHTHIKVAPWCALIKTLTYAISAAWQQQNTNKDCIFYYDVPQQNIRHSFCY